MLEAAKDGDFETLEEATHVDFIPTSRNLLVENADEWRFSQEMGLKTSIKVWLCLKETYLFCQVTTLVL